MIWNSVVGKLWATILLFFSFVLLVLTFLLTQFINNYVTNEVGRSLEMTASKIAAIIEGHDDFQFGLEVTSELIDEDTKAIIISKENYVYYSSDADEDNFPISYFLQDADLAKVISNDEVVGKEIILPSSTNEDAIIIGVPLHVQDNQAGAVFIYQSLEVMRETTSSITRIILWSAFVAFILTTVFAFFLSSRISAPLLTMRKVAFEVANGKFDTKVPILTNDEIGELATAFNQMRKTLKTNMTALNQEKEQLSSILSSMADGVLMFNRNGEIIISNPPADRFLNLWFYEQEDSDEEVPPKVKELFFRVVETGNEQMSDISLQGRYWNVVVTPLYNHKNIRGAVLVLRDMTEERRLDMFRTDFIANVSHELRTPVSMMQGYSEALMDDVASTDEDRKEIAKIINEESLRMGRLVNDLLDLARMESGHSTLLLEELPIKPYLTRIIKKFQGPALEKDVCLKFEIHDEIKSITLDADRIEQVLTNLIDNALRHTESSGMINISSIVNEVGLRIEVSDTGSGIPSEDLPFVFERFYKSDKARTRGQSGTGLGLAIAKNIVEAHSGTIDVKSKLGQGTTFTVFIPRNL